MHLERAVTALAAEAPHGWTRVDVDVHLCTMMHLFGVRVSSDSGGAPLSMRLPKVVGNDLVRARRLMYEPGRGTWLSARLTVFPDGEHRVEFNFDEEPGWKPPLHPVAYARDLEAFPRDDEHVPDWLREQLRLAEIAEAEHQAQIAPPSA
ncbi:MULTISPECIES: hypothetical protein [Actinosynnema]|uniref:hypothetical protein n=1 Tax=Actinosynnema TaxID=40566 RepID=UPI0020A5DD2F|nr:hypothetical protein [Actinosynnema pretiosum]MCP2092417.1 hypothetical protein [Actinosynnema pretiosum]